MHVNHFSAFLADAAGSGQPASPGGVQGLFSSPLLFFVVVFVMMYFLMIRPQQLRAKQQAKMLAALKSGDKVITAAGLVGIVITVKDKTVTIRSADAKFEVTKASVTEIVPEEASASTTTSN